MRRSRIWAFAFCFLFLFTACGASGNSSNTQMQDTAQIERLSTLLKQLERVEDYTASIETKAEINQGGILQSTSSSADITAVNDPFARRVSVTTTIDNDEFSHTVYVVESEQEDTVSVYTNTQDAWSYLSRDRASMEQSLQMYDVQDNLLAFLQNATQWSQTEKKPASYTAVIPAEQVYTVVNGSDILVDLGLGDLPEEYYEGVDAISITLTLPESLNQTCTVSLDLKNVVDTVMNHVMQQLGNIVEYEVTACTAEYQLMHVNAGEKITVPEEARQHSVDYANNQSDGQTAALEEATEENHAESTMETVK